MRRPRIAAFIYLIVTVCICGDIGSRVPAGANISDERQANAWPDMAAPAPDPESQVIPIAAKRYRPAKHAYRQVGIASWYGGRHQGRLTASGEIFDKNRLTAAHRTLPLDTKARITNLENGRSVEVTVNDRGPYIRGRVIDLSARAARELGMKQQGLALVRIQVLGVETANSAVD
jgi:rare lipoprotein A